MEEPGNALEELAASIAHEIKNPLALLRANLQLMELDDAGHQHQKNFQVMYGEIDKINQLLMGFFQIAKPQEYAFAVFDLGETLSRVFEDMKAMFEERDILLCFDADEKLAMVYGDEKKLFAVFVNVLKNAAEAIGEHGRVTVNLFKSEGYIVVKVEDNGRGIPEKYLREIGKPFFTTKKTGSGLGVSISKKILTAHKGIFSITSVEGKGSAVAITLPEYHAPAADCE